MANFNGYLLDGSAISTLELLSGGYAFPLHKADHITQTPHASDFTGLKDIHKVAVTGFASDNNGIEAFLVAVNGQETRADGDRYHLTWSLDPHREIAPALYAYEPAGAGKVLYQPRHAATMLRAFFEGVAGHNISAVRFPRRVEVPVVPVLVTKPSPDKRIVKIFKP